jgi:hypothetical protein
MAEEAWTHDVFMPNSTHLLKTGRRPPFASRAGSALTLCQHTSLMDGQIQSTEQEWDVYTNLDET